MLRTDPLFWVVAAATVGVAIILMMGISNFGKGGDPKVSNKYMRWRIIAQFVAVGLLLAFVAIRGGGN